MLQIWKDQQLWVTIICRDDDARYRLCYFAIAEGLEPLLLQWLDAHTEEQYSVSLTDRPHAWRGWLLRGIIHGFLGLDTTRNADPALKCFFEVIDQISAAKARRTTADPPPILNTNGLPAMSCICRELMSGWYRQTDPRLYDRFIRHFMANPRKNYGFDFRISALHLQHPARPTATYAVEFIKQSIEAAKDSELPSVAEEDIAAKGTYLKEYFQHIEELLKPKDPRTVEWAWKQYERVVKSGGESMNDAKVISR